jgi:hypothetical protein
MDATVITTNAANTGATTTICEGVS